MHPERLRTPAVVAIVGLVTIGLFGFQATLADACDVTVPSATLKDGPVVRLGGSGQFWHGSSKLAVLLTRNGEWPIKDASRRYSDKLWWWREGYVASAEPEPPLVLVGKQLDGDRLTFELHGATHGLVDDVDLMLTDLRFPAPGCWEVTGSYADTSLSFVTRVGDSD